MEFKTGCKEKIENKSLGPHEFEAGNRLHVVYVCYDCACLVLSILDTTVFPTTGLKEFLDKSATELQAVFDSACGFFNVQRCLMEQLEYVIKQIASLEVTAGKLVKNVTSSRAGIVVNIRHVIYRGQV